VAQQVIEIVAAVLGPELTELLLTLSPVADQLPEIGSVEPHEPFGTVPVTCTVIEAVEPLARLKGLELLPLQVTTWAGLLLIVTVPVLAGFVEVEDTPASHPAVPP
jgi:hypothetical protein